MNKIVLSNLTEYQQSLLTRFSYLNIDFDAFKKFQQDQTRITITDLKSIILNPNEPYLGNLHFPRLKIALSGVCTTNFELFEELESAGLGNLEVIDLANNQKSGFNAICFKDSMQNVGFSFRGTDLKTFSSLAADSLADVEAFLTNHNEQVEQAQTLFAKHQNLAGQNFLYGHSLGGFLAESVYLHNHANIANAFVINPLHIDSQYLETKSQIAVFNHPLKFSCFVTGGDYVSSINDPTLFANNVHYVKNNKKYVNNPISNHLIESALFDEYESFVECPKEIAFAGHESPELEQAIQFIKKDQVRGSFSRAFSALRNYFSTIRLYFGNLFKKEKQPEGVIEQTPPIPQSDDFRTLLDPKNYPSYQKADKTPPATITRDTRLTKGEDYEP